MYAVGMLRPECSQSGPRAAPMLCIDNKPTFDPTFHSFSTQKGHLGKNTENLNISKYMTNHLTGGPPVPLI